MSEKRWTRAWIGLSVVLYLAHFYTLARYYIDVPFGDEWELYQPRLKNLPFSWAWIVDFHNEHRMIWTKMITAVFARMGLLNYPAMGIFSFAIYGLLVIVLYRLARKIGLAASVIAPFLIFFVSSAGSENFFWPFQSAFHLVFLFFFGALLVFEADRVARIVVAILLIGCAVFSMSAGVMLALGFAVGATALPAIKKRGWLPSAAIVLATGAFLALWSWGFHRGADANPYVWPIHWRFWQHFLTMLSWLGGYAKVNDAITAITAVLLGTSIYSILRKWRSPDSDVWTVSVWVGSMFMALGVISLGRASYGGGQGKAGRYAEIVMMLLPAVVWGFDRLQSVRWRNRLLVSLWLLCLIGYGRDFLFARKYAALSVDRLAGLECLRKTPDSECLSIYPNGPVGNRLARANELGATFVKEVSK